MDPLKMRLLALLGRAVNVRGEEVRAVLLSFAYFFCLLCGYYILRPLREEMGIAGGVHNLPWLFTGTFAVMLAAVPAFGAAVSRFPRRRLVPLTYRFFIATILLWYVLFTIGAGRVYLARAFFIWVSVYNLFVVSVFWSFMADLFKSGQGKRLFGFIAAGGTAGAILGPAITAFLAVPLGPLNLLLISAAFLELAVQCIRLLLRAPGVNKEGGPAPGEEAIGGSIFAGAARVFRSPYLMGICLYILLFTTTSTFVYFQQAHIVSGAFDDPAERTRIFGAINLIVGLLTLIVQWFVTGRFMARFGVGAAAAFLPIVAVVGFFALALSPVLWVLIAFQSIRRASNFAISRPAREVLFTVVSREDKYKSKNFIDTAVYRGGDAVSGWAFAGLSALGLGLPVIAALCVPLAALWARVALGLGKKQENLAGTG
ncbi:MAG: MFS transporter [Nitrospinota bacterium]